MHQSYLTFSSDTELKDGSLQDARNLLSLALSGLAEAADETTLQTAGGCRIFLPLRSAAVPLCPARRHGYAGQGAAGCASPGGALMTTTAKIEELQKSVINAINNSCLHPAVVRLVLLNVISMVEASEREVNKKEEEATR